MKTFLTTLTLLTYCVFSFGQLWEENNIQFNSTPSSTNQSSAIIDFDCDGLSDIIYGNQARREFWLLRNNEDHLLQLEKLSDTLYNITYLKTIDYNEDGFDDFVINTASENMQDALWMCINDGTGNFTWHFISYSAYEGLYLLEMNDFDGDGDNDFIFDDTANSNVLWVATNNGSDVFDLTFIEYTGQPTKLYGMADLDGDNDMDLMSSYYSFTQSQWILVAQENTGGMTFVAHEIFPISGPGRGTIGQFAGTDLPDMIYAAFTGTSAPGVFENLGNFVFSQTSTLSINTYSDLSPSFDYDSDGDDDFLSYYDGNLSVVKQNANSTFTEQQIIPAVSNLFLGRGEFNGDGLPDIVAKGLEVYQQNTLTNYNSIFTNQFQGSAKGIVADVDNNGKTDVLALGGTGALTIYKQRFNELMESPIALSLSGVDVQFSSSLRKILPFDKDNDGDNDLLCVFNASIYWLINNNNTYTQQLVLNNYQSQESWIGNLDGDAFHDILIFESTMHKLEWNGNSYTNIDMGYVGSNYFTVTDFDGDGDKDIFFILVTFDSKEARLLKNNNNVFSNELILDLNGLLSMNFFNDANFDIYPGDLDDDGDNDMLFSSNADDVLYWLKNDNNTTYTLEHAFENLSGAESFQIGDLDQDNDQDIVVANRANNEVLLLSNDGNEIFTPVTIGMTLSYPESVQITDIDEDNDKDVVFTSIIDRRIGWLGNPLNDCPRVYSSTSETICNNDSLFFAGDYISLEGLYTDTLTAITGCDSVLAFVLNHFPLQTITITQTVNTLHATTGFSDYQWTLNGELLSGETSNSFDATAYGLGTYQVSVIGNNGCIVVSATMEVTNLVGIKERSAVRTSLFPNPCREYCILHSDASSIESIRVLNSSGQSISGIKSQYMSGGRYYLATSELAPGMYAVEIKHVDQTMEYCKLVVE